MLPFNMQIDGKKIVVSIFKNHSGQMQIRQTRAKMRAINEINIK